MDVMAQRRGEAGTRRSGLARGRITHSAPLLAGVVAFALIVAACDTGDPDGDEASDQPQDPEVTLQLGHGFPPEHVLQQEMLEPWSEEIAEATDGTVEIDIRPGGALTEAQPAYENTVGGVADISWSLQSYTPGRFPLTEIVELPFLFESAEEATDALWDLYENSEALQQEYDDVEVLALWTLTPGQLWTVETQPTSIEDLEGLTLRGPGRVQIRMLEALGAEALTMPAPDIFDSLERGVMEGLVIDPVGVAAFGLADVLNYRLDAGFYTSAMFLVLNQDSWNELSEDQQAVFEEQRGRELSQRIAAVFDEASAGVLESVAGEIEVTEIDDVEPWREATSQVVDDWIQDAEDDGLPGQELHDQLMDVVDLPE